MGHTSANFKTLMHNTSNSTPTASSESTEDTAKNQPEDNNIMLPPPGTSTMELCCILPVQAAQTTPHQSTVTQLLSAITQRMA